METCHYCGYSYHPMPVYRLSNDREKWRVTTPFQIHVCHLRVAHQANGEIEIDQHWRGCAERAEADGYEYRRDLTPRR